MTRVPLSKLQRFIGKEVFEGWVPFRKQISSLSHKWWSANPALAIVYSSTDDVHTVGKQGFDALIVAESDDATPVGSGRIVDLTKSKATIMTIGIAVIESKGSFEQRKAKLMSFIPDETPSMSEIFVLVRKT